VAIVLTSLLALGQSRKTSERPLPPEAFKLKSINATGSKRYKAEDIARATGLQIGQTVHDDDFQAAARHLGDSGVFTNVGYTFSYSPDGTKLEFQVEDNDKFVPVRFENFVWFSDQEIIEKLHETVPLFNGQLPVSGELASRVSDVLQAMLLEKKIPGEVDYLRVSKQDGPIEAIAFSVSGGPRLLIHTISFSGAAPPELPLLETAAKKLGGTQYSLNDLHIQVEKTFLPVYLAHGYLRAEFSEPVPTILPKTSSDPTDDSDDASLVDVSFNVNPGRQYKVDELGIEGNKVVPVDRIRSLIALKSGDPANPAALEDALTAVKKLYGTKGYIEAMVRAEPEMDDARLVVKYRIVIKEGDVFKMGELEIEGLDSKATSQAQNDWTMREGDVYDSGYPRKFVAQVLKEILTTGQWKVQIHDNLNEKEKTVDIVVRFDLK